MWTPEAAGPSWKVQTARDGLVLTLGTVERSPESWSSNGGTGQLLV